MAKKKTEEETADTVIGRNEEWHVTVLGSVYDWVDYCDEQGWKPLFLELNDGALQLMATCDRDPRELADDGKLGAQGAFTIIRVKHEVENLRDGEVALYYEAHVKLDGAYRRDRKNSSRDLLRSTDSPSGLRGRWYLTQRSRTPFDVQYFAELAQGWSKQSTLVGVESEVVIEDTNPDLDGYWGR